MSQVFDFFEARFSKKLVDSFFSVAIVAAGIVILIFLFKSHTSLIKTIISIALLIAGLMFAWRIKIPAEKIHILEYGLLGWLAARDLIAPNKKLRKILEALTFTFIVGLSDELLQKALPYRVFDLRDIVFNSLGGAWGISLYLLRL